MLSKQESLRYARQTALPEIGEQGQLKLRDASVLLVGAGGLGAPAALYLAGAGVGKILIADGDQVDITNLHRQILYRQDNAGESKSDSAETQLGELNPEVTVESIDERLDADALDYYVPEVDLVLDCSDNLTTRLAINAACYEHEVPLVSGAAIRWDGQLSVYDFRHRDTLAACYQCLFGDELPPAQHSCSEMGVVGPAVGLIGTAMALEALKLLLGMESGTQGTLQIFEGKSFSWRQMKLSRHPNCPVCSG